MVIRREENFIPIDNKDLFNPQSLCSITGHAWDGDEREMRKGDRMVTRRGEVTASMMRMVALHLCIVLYNVSVCT